MVFIRAPRIRQMGPGVVTLARRGDETVMAREGTVLVASFHPEPVMAREGTVLVASFHPELTEDPSVHQYFCEMVREAAHPS
jgi:pyridoxal 5'-phosphate synthase pdxT subunit